MFIFLPFCYAPSVTPLSTPPSHPASTRKPDEGQLILVSPSACPTSPFFDLQESQMSRAAASMTWPLPVPASRCASSAWMEMKRGSVARTGEPDDMRSSAAAGVLAKGTHPREPSKKTCGYALWWTPTLLQKTLLRAFIFLVFIQFVTFLFRHQVSVQTWAAGIIFSPYLSLPSASCQHLLPLCSTPTVCSSHLSLPTSAPSHTPIHSSADKG